VSGCCRSSTTSARKKAFRNSLLIDAVEDKKDYFWVVRSVL
jgi:hypothetical protein